MMKATYIKSWFLLLAITLMGYQGLHAQDEMQKLQLDFTTPNGYVRHILLGFTPDNSATDGYDYGYDSLNVYPFTDDLDWTIENKRYVIQGVGAFDDTKTYPLGLYLTNSGNIKIDLAGTYNFDSSINVFIYDAVLDTYTQINDSDYASYMESGEYVDRFYVTFNNSAKSSFAKSSLSNPDETLEHAQINFLRNTKELFIKTKTGNNINAITIYDINGKKQFSLNNLRDSFVKTSLDHLNNSYCIVAVETDDGKVSSKQLIIN
ncbi:hypothetical protein [Aestuariivivens insulae]|uniref:hypothetical protein n=1 Tax=Aestuariivivens insulae TaxID=1621988 RepID=UPI001F59E610|nr:hypothetical protein [Aestuariivivens insulae]